MKKYINGEYIEMTPEEEQAHIDWALSLPDYLPSETDRINELEDRLAELQQLLNELSLP